MSTMLYTIITVPAWISLTLFVGANKILMLSSSDIDECDLNNACDHTCNNNDGSFTCSCNIGYTLNVDGRTCDGKTMFSNIQQLFSVQRMILPPIADKNECDLDRPCDQGCINNVGSYQCTCSFNYTLNADGVTCQG